jgi:hypothetical protein
VGAVALVALVIATAVISVSETGNQVADEHLSLEGPAQFSSGSSNLSRGGTQFSDTPRTAGSGLPPGAEKAASGAKFQSSSAAVAPAASPRDVESDAELVLLARSDEIAEASSDVFAAVHAADGIVLSSSVEDRGTDANAEFELLIPSAELSDALASLSQIAEVRSRRESTRDITAPTSGVETRLADSRARIDGLLAQLASAESEEERTAVEAELRSERKRAAILGSQLDQIRRRADFAEVSLRIESGAVGDSGSETWGVGNAIGDAGRILTIAAAVAVISLAVITPLALILLLTWLAHRTWMRQRRQRALG